MKNMQEKIKKSKRKLIQLYAALLYNAYLKGFLKGEIFTGISKGLCVPGLNCYSCPGAVSACPLGSLQTALASANTRIGFYIFGILLLYGIIAGRTICGWICPFGLIQELLHKIPTPKLRKNKITQILTYVKYGILGIFVILIPLWQCFFQGLSVPGFCKYICPAGTLEAALPLLAHPANRGLYDSLGFLFLEKVVILILFLAACILIYRCFCRFICPLGAIYGLFYKICFIKINVDEKLCNSCGQCVKTCPVDILHAGDRECIHCGNCISSCNRGAISLKAGKITLLGPDLQSGENPGKDCNVVRVSSKENIIALLLFVLLLFVLLWAGFLAPQNKWKADSALSGIAGPDGVIPGTGEEHKGTVENKEEGFEVGQQLPDFSIECLDGSNFHLADYRGKIVILNLWATYCGPCVEEMPYFCEFQKTHEDVVILALHHPLTTTSVDAFIDGMGWELSFAVDKEENGSTTLWEKVGGTSVLPQTIVINKDGIVTTNRPGSVTPKLLEEFYQDALE